MKKIIITLLGLFSFSIFAAESYEMKELNWLAGNWVEQNEKQTLEENFTTADGGVVLGNFKILSGDDLSFYELIQIKEMEGGISYTPFVFGIKGVSFKLESLTENNALFVNNNNEFPKSIEYTLKENGRLDLMISGVQDNQLVVMTVHYTKK